MLYRVDYQEVHMFEEYIEATSPEDASEQFINSLQADTITPMEQEIVMYEIEACYEKKIHAMPVDAEWGDVQE